MALFDYFSPSATVMYVYNNPCTISGIANGFKAFIYESLPRVTPCQANHTEVINANTKNIINEILCNTVIDGLLVIKDKSHGFIHLAINDVTMITIEITTHQKIPNSNKFATLSDNA